MRIEKISSSQLVFLIAGNILGASMLMGFAGGVTKHDTWVALLVALVVSLPLAWIYVTLLEKFPGKNLIQINAIIYGSYVGDFISILYIWVFFSFGALSLREFGAVINEYLLPETPTAVILILFGFLSAWALRYGIEVIARCGFSFVAITTINIILTTILLMKEMKVTNFLPILEAPLPNFIQSIHLITASPFQMVILLMIAPYVNKINEVKKSTLVGLFFGGIALFIMTLRNTGALGIIEPIMAFPSYRVVRFINIADIITRLESIVAFGSLMTLFLRITLYHYATVVGIAQLFRLKTYVPLVIPIGMMMINVALLAFDSSVEMTVFNTKVMPLYFLPFEVILPIISLCIVKMRETRKQQGEECQ